MLRRLAWSVSFASLLAGCGGGGGSEGGGGVSPGSATAPPLVTETYSFPAGDATAASGIAWDIVGVKTTLSGTPGSPGGNLYDTLRVDVTFVQDISNALPAPGQSLLNGSQLGVGIALDIDGDPNTGEYAACHFINALRPFEYFSDTGTETTRLLDGNYAIIDPTGNFVSSGGSNPAAEAVTAVSGHIFSQTFYLPTIAVFGGNVIPHIGLGLAAYNGSIVMSSDCVPKAPTVEVFTRQ